MCTNGDFSSSLRQQKRWSTAKKAGSSGDARDLIDPDALSSQPDVIQQEEEGNGEMRSPRQLIHRGGNV